MRSIILCTGCEGRGTYIDAPYSTYDDPNDYDGKRYNCKICKGSGRLWENTEHTYDAFVNEPLSEPKGETQ